MKLQWLTNSIAVLGLVGLSGCKWRQFTGFDNRLKRLFFKAAFNFYSLTIPSPDEEREVELGIFVDEEGDIDDESDVELDLETPSTMTTILSQIEFTLWFSG